MYPGTLQKSQTLNLAVDVTHDLISFEKLDAGEFYVYSSYKYI